MGGEVPSIERDKPHEDEIEQQEVYGETEDTQTKSPEDLSEQKETLAPVDSKVVLSRMMQELSDMPDKMLAEERRAIAASRKIDAHDKRAREIEQEIYAEVNTETDEDGKKKFSNEKMREAETNKRLNTHAEMQQIREERQAAVEKQQSARSEYDYLKRKMKSYELIGMLAKLKWKVD